MNVDEAPIAAPLLAAAAMACIGALFAGADTALTSLTAARLEALTQQATGGRRSALERVTAKRRTIHARYLLGRLLCAVLAVGSFCWWAFRSEAPLALRLGLSAAALLVLAALYETATALGRSAADWVVPTAARILRPLELLLVPLAESTAALSRLVVRRQVPSGSADPRVTEAEVEIMVEHGERSGVLEQEPAELIRNVLEFSELTARDAMVPRTKVVAIELATPLDEVLRTVVESGHSRYPVYDGRIDDLVGLLYAKDLFRLIQRGRTLPPGPALREAGPVRVDADDAASWLAERSDRASDPVVSVEEADRTPLPPRAALHAPTLRDLIRTPINFVSESQPLSSLLRGMKLKRQHLAVVVNEFGGMSGIVTLEDVLEEIVGDIEDESDAEEAAPIVDLGGGHLVADASVLLDDLGSYLGMELDPDGEYDSLGGMLVERLGRVPEVGAHLSAYGLHFAVRAADEKRVEQVEITREPPRPLDDPDAAVESGPSPSARHEDRDVS
ncbi:MAG: HlyC/CorC family transporter [Myxococcales bacterium]|nr:HlyC/CorC family transporter [Myxococcales bacterium]